MPGCRRRAPVLLSVGTALLAAPLAAATRPSAAADFFHELELADSSAGEAAVGLAAGLRRMPLDASSLAVEHEVDTAAALAAAHLEELAAAELATTLEVSHQIRAFMKNEPLMCGDTAIRNILKVKDGFDVEKVKNIRFDDAFNQANAYLAYQTQQVNTMTDNLKALQARWFAVSSVEHQKKPELDKAVLQSAIEEAIKTSYHSLAEAKSRDCLVPAEEVGGQDPFEATKHKFHDVLAELLRDGQHTVSERGEVESYCNGFVGDGKNVNCADLCKAVSAIAVSFYTGPNKDVAGEDAGTLQQQISDTQAGLVKLQQEIKECEDIREGIRVYKGKLDGISSKYDMHGRLSRHAQSKLRTVGSFIRGLKERLDAQDAQLKELSPILEKTRDQHASVKEEMDASLRDSASLRGLVDSMTKNLDDLQGMLQDSHSAVNAVANFKAGLVLAMHNFVQIYNDTINAPLNDIGVLQAAAALKDDQWPDVTKSDSPFWERPREESKKLSKQCLAVSQAGVTMCEHQPKLVGDPAESVKAEVQQLCEEGTRLKGACPGQADYVADIKGLIVKKQADVRTLLHNLLQEVDIPPSLAGKGASKSGEPQYMRQLEAIRALSGSKFVSDYVSKWSSEAAGDGGQGIMFEMQKALKEAAGDITEKTRSATDKLKELDDKWLGNVHSDMGLSKRLQELSAKLTTEERQKIGIDVKIEEFRSGIQRKEEDQVAFREDREEFQRNLAKLTDALHEAFEDMRSTASTNFARPDHSADLLEGGSAAEEELGQGRGGSRRLLPHSAQGDSLLRVF